MLALAQMFESVLDAEPLEVEADPDAIGCAAPEESRQFHLMSRPLLGRPFL
jgi:hypothetical protein